MKGERNRKEATKGGGGNGAWWRQSKVEKQTSNPNILAWLTSVIVIIPNQ